MPDQHDNLPTTMAAVYLHGFGDTDQLEFVTDAPVPAPGPNEVLIRVTASSVNNTDINTRTGWYSREVVGSSGDAAATETGHGMSGWAGTLTFPRIQGADACGRIVAAGDGVDPSRLGQRVIVATMQTAYSADQPYVTTVFGSEYDGAFAQYAVANSDETFAVDCEWTDAELASIPCAYSTAENMLHRIELGADRVLITGASGGVGHAAVQLAKRRGASVVAMVGADKAEAVQALGADEVVDRSVGGGVDVVERFGENSFDVIVDVVAGPFFAQVTSLLRLGGRYITSGAIAGPIVELDVRDLYLKDLTLKGATYQSPEVFGNLVGYIERGEIRPSVAATYPLEEIVAAQEAFLDKRYVGKIVLLHPD